MKVINKLNQLNTDESDQQVEPVEHVQLELSRVIRVWGLCLLLSIGRKEYPSGHNPSRSKGNRQS
jgi:hypothetical protein